MKPDLKKATFAQTGEPMVTDSKGKPITKGLLLNSDTILYELASYYGWQYRGSDKEEHYDRAFSMYLSKLHYNANKQGEDVNEFTHDEYETAYAGNYGSLEEFAEDHAENTRAIGYTESYIRDNINWTGIAEYLITRGGFVAAYDTEHDDYYLFLEQV